jgi:predicted Rossmann fold nucleotide-binding protein DprA/Smf involved in DNA uptake
MEGITEPGGIHSEYPLGTKPEASHFARRNRLLMGLSVARLVTEARDGISNQSGRSSRRQCTGLWDACLDQLSSTTGSAVANITGSLTVMERQGRALQVGRMKYIRAREANTADGASEEK